MAPRLAVKAISFFERRTPFTHLGSTFGGPIRTAWPAYSLMIAFTAEYAGGDIRCDPNEIAEARCQIDQARLLTLKAAEQAGYRNFAPQTLNFQSRFVTIAIHNGRRNTSGRKVADRRIVVRRRGEEQHDGGSLSGEAVVEVRGSWREPVNLYAVAAMPSRAERLARGGDREHQPVVGMAAEGGDVGLVLGLVVIEGIGRFDQDRIDDDTAELPMLALIFTRKLRPMIIGSLSG